MLCGGLVIYAVTDLMMHNRKKAAEMVSLSSPIIFGLFGIVDC